MKTSWIISVLVSILICSCSNHDYTEKNQIDSKDSLEIMLSGAVVDTMFYEPALLPDNEFIIPCIIKDSLGIAAHINHLSQYFDSYYYLEDLVYTHINYDKDIYIEYCSETGANLIGKVPLIIIFRKSLNKACLISNDLFMPQRKLYVQFYDKTPLVATTLSRKAIAGIFPTFSGKYQQIKVDSILLDYNDKFFSIQDYPNYKTHYLDKLKNREYYKYSFYESIRVYTQYRNNKSRLDFQFEE